jgi:hypothetical protein
MAHLPEEIRTIEEKMGAYQEMMDDGQEKMKAQVASLDSWISGSQKWYRDWHLLPVSHRGRLKKWTQGNGGSWMKLAAAYRGMTRHAVVAQHKVCSHKGLTIEQRQPKNQTKDSISRGTSKGRTFGRRHLAKPESITGVVVMSGKQVNTWQDLQEDRGAGGRKVNSWDFQRLRIMSVITKESASSETEETANRVRAGNVGRSATLGSSAHTDQRKMVKILD